MRGFPRQKFYLELVKEQFLHLFNPEGELLEEKKDEFVTKMFPLMKLQFRKLGTETFEHFISSTRIINAIKALKEVPATSASLIPIFSPQQLEHLEAEKEKLIGENSENACCIQAIAAYYNAIIGQNLAQPSSIENVEVNDGLDGDQSLFNEHEQSVGAINTQQTDGGFGVEVNSEDATEDASTERQIDYDDEFASVIQNYDEQEVVNQAQPANLSISLDFGNSFTVTEIERNISDSESSDDPGMNVDDTIIMSNESIIEKQPVKKFLMKIIAGQKIFINYYDEPPPDDTCEEIYYGDINMSQYLNNTDSSSSCS